MSLILDGSNGVSDIDGTASTPAIRGTDANTGIFFPAADTIAFAEGGAESMRLDSNGNVGVGNTSPPTGVRLTARAPSSSGYNYFLEQDNGLDGYLLSCTAADGALKFFRRETNGTNTTERMRITAGGDLFVGNTSVPSNTVSGVRICNPSTDTTRWSCGTTTTSLQLIQFVNGNGVVGSITTSGSGTSYVTSSDYRLKENIAPMTGALAKVQQLKPCTYTWKADGSDGQGFIAHELAEVCPEAVTGEKDAVDENGNPKYQGIDTSFLVATLTSAIQELNAKVEAQAAKIAELEAK